MTLPAPAALLCSDLGKPSDTTRQGQRQGRASAALALVLARLGVCPRW